MKSWRTICIAALLALISGCSDAEDVSKSHATKPQSPTQDQAQPEPSPWQLSNGEARIAMANQSDDQELADAIAKARSTADEARQLWKNATNEQRSQWAIKWAAPTAEGKIEHVWVKPIVTWSRFRIEGKLANQPTVELACDKTLGQLVSFPIEELSDWMHLIEGTADEKALREGGFTMKLLQQRYGEPE